jgi:CheY-like chemotaxis protein
LKPVELLLVEDSPGDILLISQVLRDEPIPIKIRVAVDGEQALQMLEDSQFRPDLVILDLNIPKVSGLSFLARYALEAPVVVFSSCRVHTISAAHTSLARRSSSKSPAICERSRGGWDKSCAGGVFLVTPVPS